VEQKETEIVALGYREIIPIKKTGDAKAIDNIINYSYTRLKPLIIPSDSPQMA